ncbi:hypothetical protein NXC14_PA00119 (plasmid) [Rhizobium sp. NXC14]|nr:hypothetical protein NXC14_PA00119 [Rhizobium sp. NXC14]
MTNDLGIIGLVLKSWRMERWLSSDFAILSISAATHKGYARDANKDSFLVDHRRHSL